MPVPAQESIDRLRALTDAATTDEFHGVTYWTDAQLSEELVRQSQTIRLLPLTVNEFYADGVLQQTVYRLPDYAGPSWEINIASLKVTNATGTAIAQTPTLVSGNTEIELDANPTSTDIYVSFTVYDIYRAAASVWEQKAAHRAQYVDIKAGPNSMKLQQEYEHAVQRAAYFKSKKPNSFQRVKRSGFKPFRVNGRFGL